VHLGEAPWTRPAAGFVYGPAVLEGRSIVASGRLVNVDPSTLEPSGMTRMTVARTEHSIGTCGIPREGLGVPFSPRTSMTSERRADLLGFGRLWFLSLAEPIETEVRGAYELPSKRAA